MSEITIDHETQAPVLVSLSIPVPATNYQNEARAFLDSARALKVTTPEQAKTVAEDLRKIKALWKKVDETRKELKQPIDAEAAKVQAFYKPALDWLKEAEDIQKKALEKFMDEEDRKRREAEARAAEAARIEREKLEAKAREAEAAGKAEKADALRERAETVAITAPAPTPATKLAGIGSAFVYEAEVIDFADLLAFIVVNPMYHYLLKIDQTALDRIAGTLKDNFQMPGTKLVKKRSLSAKSA